MAEPGISDKFIREFKTSFEAAPQYRVAQNACTKHNPLEILRKRAAEENVSHVFSDKVEMEGKPMTNQNASGRCWIYSCLNCMRIPFMKALNIEEFEFSQNFLFFWDKIERMNFHLNSFIETARRGETADGRLVFHLLGNPAEDGGQWNMLVNLIEKYGVVPKSTFPDAWSSENSRYLNKFFDLKAREFCMDLHNLVKKGASEDDLQATTKRMMEEVFRIVSICLGTAPEIFTYEYYDKDKKYHKIGPISPKDFYIQHVKPLFNLEDKVILVNDPRPDNPYRNLYTVDFLNNMVGGRQALYINLPVDVLKKTAAESIKNNEAVWFGCDNRQCSSWKKFGFGKVDGFDFEGMFGTPMNAMSKADRLIYRDSLMTHAMVLTAFSQEEGKITSWRIENSWGPDFGDKGFLMMTDDWFSEFTYEVVVDKKYVPADILAILKQEPRVLPAWDPMGSLA